ncbi:MAG: LicD family protein [Lachnospiraceae bacterium]|nr:LicD family protein [Lachnospiraceae bacterium]
MDFSVDFFRDEVRNGFYIPTAIKQAWAASLTVLSEIDRICEKYNIAYFADWGSILGAVRHGGFIPWDDDLDICMKRDDYVRFRSVADAELPGEYTIHDYERKEDHWLFLSRVVNQSQICFDQAHLEQYHNFPYMSGVDIFLQDYLYQDEEKERERSEEIKRLLAVADGIVEGNLQKDTIEREFAAIEHRYHVRLDPEAEARSLGIAIYQLAEQQMARVPKKEADSVGQIFPWILKGGKGLPKEYYEKIVRLPFENTTIPVPACYNKVLQSRYGNYLEVYKEWNGHEYPFFEGQRENLQAVADFKLPEFSFDPDMVKKRDPNRNAGDSLKSIAAECIGQLHEMTGQLIRLAKDSEYEEVLSLLPECQQLAVDLGTLVEEVKGTERKSCQLVVAGIQAYCDALYEIFLVLTGQTADVAAGGNTMPDLSQQITQLQSAFQGMRERIQEQIVDRGEILFLAIGPWEWKGFTGLYEAAVSDDECDIYVVPLPMLFKDALGRVTADGEAIEAAIRADEYPESVPLTSWTEYNVQLHQPERIYIQNPYDGENPCLTIPPQYYAGNLRNYTDKLIYIPPFEVDEFGEKDHNDLYNMKHYVTAPGVIYADKVIVQSENMQQRYVEKLTEFAGEATRALWEDKIKPLELPVRAYREHGTDDTAKKKMLYCIGLNELSEYKTEVVKCIRERLELFKENGDSIHVTVGFYPADMSEWRRTDSRLTEEIIELLHTYEDKSWYRRCELQKTGFVSVVADHDAYYGSPSPLVLLFTHEKKPVMLADYAVDFYTRE